jgi:hypothetical protein
VKKKRQSVQRKPKKEVLEAPIHPAQALAELQRQDILGNASKSSSSDHQPYRLKSQRWSEFKTAPSIIPFESVPSTNGTKFSD